MRQGLNFTIQSSASDILLCGLIGVTKRFRDNNLDARVVATVHDSLEIVSSEDHLEDALAIIYDELVNYPYLKKLFGIHFAVPLSVDMEVGRSFGDGQDVHFTDGKATNIKEIIEYLHEN